MAIPNLSPIFSNNQFFKPQCFCAFPFFKPPFAALWAEHLYQNKSWVPPGVCPLPSHWLRPWCKIGGKRVLLGMHIYKIYTKYDGNSRPTERKNMKNAYRGGRTLKTPPPHTHTHMFFHVPLGISTPRDTTIIEVTWLCDLLIKQYPAVDMPIIMDEDDRPSWLTQQWNMTCLLPI